MSVVGRRFSVTIPDWGAGHLTSEAVVAYVDDELAEGPQARATRHLAGCPECAAQVVAQGQARAALRSAHCPSLPSSLLSSLRAIPQDAPLPPTPPGLSVTEDGQFVAVLRPSPPAERPRRTQASSHRRVRLGPVAAISGLALGALALAAAVPSDTPAPPASADHGVLGRSGGPALVTARLQLPAPAIVPADGRGPG